MNFVIDPATLNMAFGEVSPPKQLSSGMHCEIKTCPKCKNAKWKATVNLENGWFYCQVCQEKGIHIFQLIPEEDAKMLRARMAKEHVDEPTPVTPLPPIPEFCVTLDSLYEEHPAILYLRSRRVEPFTAFSKGIVWKPWGIPAWHKKDKPIFDSLQGLIHPMYRRGELTAWQFEAVPRIPGSTLPKYVTAPGSQLGSSFFNFDTVESESRCVVVEGVYDALRLPFSGVAVCKDTLSKRQVKLLSTCGFKEIVLLLDSDRTDDHMQKELAKLKLIASARAIRLEQGDPADHHEDALIRILGWRANTDITQHETLRQAALSIEELAAERTAAWLSK
jgi:hypothetical protein